MRFKSFVDKKKIDKKSIKSKIDKYISSLEGDEKEYAKRYLKSLTGKAMVTIHPKHDNIRKKIDSFLIKEAKKQDFWQKKEGADYMIRELRPGEYEVSKWTRGDTPTEIYKCYQKGKNQWQCGCPVKGKCKHIKMVQDWLKGGKQPFVDISDLPQLAKKFLK